MRCECWAETSPNIFRVYAAAAENRSRAFRFCSNWSSTGATWTSPSTTGWSSTCRSGAIGCCWPKGYGRVGEGGRYDDFFFYVFVVRLLLLSIFQIVFSFGAFSISKSFFLYFFCFTDHFYVRVVRFAWQVGLVHSNFEFRINLKYIKNFKFRNFAKSGPHEVFLWFD